jgi:hypothetical protein
MKKYQNLMDLISKGFSSVLEMLSKKGIFKINKPPFNIKKGGLFYENINS